MIIGRSSVVAVLILCAGNCFALWKGETAHHARVAMKDARQSRCKDLTKADIAEIERATGKKYQFVIAKVDNRDGDKDFEFKPYWDKARADTRQQQQYLGEDVSLEIIGADLSEATRALFGRIKVGPKGQGVFAIAFPDGLKLTNTGTVTIYDLIQDDDHVIVRCE